MKVINDTSSIPHLLIQEIMHTCFGGEVNSCASWYLNPKMGRQLAAGIFHKCAKVLPPAQLTKVKGAFALFRPVLGTRQRIYNTAWWHLETHHKADHTLDHGDESILPWMQCFRLLVREFLLAARVNPT